MQSTDGADVRELVDRLKYAIAMARAVSAVAVLAMLALAGRVVYYIAIVATRGRGDELMLALPGLLVLAGIVLVGMQFASRLRQLGPGSVTAVLEALRSRPELVTNAFVVTRTRWFVVKVKCLVIDADHRRLELAMADWLRVVELIRARAPHAVQWAPAQVAG